MSVEDRHDIDLRKKNRDWLALSAKFALAVRHILRSEKITQTELARRMGVSSVQVSKILSGKENIGLQTIAKIERALDRSIVTFCGITEPQINNSSKSSFGPVIQPYTSNVASNMYTGVCEPEPGGYSDSRKE